MIVQIFITFYLVDDGRGTVTSTYTAETRYSNISPARTYEYAKGTITNLPHDERGTTPTAYTETRTFDVPKSGELRGVVTPSETRTHEQLRGDSRSYPSVLDGPRPYASPVPKDTKERAKSYDQLDSGSSGFITESRSYDTKTSGEYRDLESSSFSVRQYGTGDNEMEDRQQAPLRYFGEEPAKSVSSASARKSDERYRSSSREDIPSYGREPLVSGVGYTRSTFDPEKLRSNGHLRREGDLPETAKGPSIRAPFIESYDRTKSDVTADRQQKVQQTVLPPVAVLERTEEMERLPKSWKSIEKMDRDRGYYREPSAMKTGRMELEEDHRYAEERRKGVCHFPLNL